MKRSKGSGNGFVLFVYILSALIYGFYAAVKCGALALGGTREEFFSDLVSLKLHLSDYMAVRNDPAVLRLFLLNFARGLLFFALLYLVSRLIPYCFRTLTQSGQAGPTQNKEESRMIRRTQKKPQNGKSAGQGSSRPERVDFDALFSGRDEAPRRPASQERARKAAKEAAREGRRAVPQQQPQRREPAPAARAPKEDYYPELSADRDNIRVIVKLMQTDTEGKETLSFYCGDTVTVEEYPAKGFGANLVPFGSDSEIKRFIRDTRRGDDEVYYVFDIFQSSQHPVMLKGSHEDALRLLEEGFLLRIYREKVILITPRVSRVNTVDSKAQEVRSVWAVSGTDNVKSRTRRFAQTFYQHDDGIRMEIEVRFKIAARTN